MFTLIKSGPRPVWCLHILINNLIIGSSMPINKLRQNASKSRSVNTSIQSDYRSITMSYCVRKLWPSCGPDGFEILVSFFQIFGLFSIRDKAGKISYVRAISLVALHGSLSAWDIWLLCSNYGPIMSGEINLSIVVFAMVLVDICFYIGSAAILFAWTTKSHLFMDATKQLRQIMDEIPGPDQAKVIISLLNW